MTNTNDGGTGSLRACLENAISGAQINFDTAVFPAIIVLTSPLPDINQGNLTIDTSDAGVVLDGSGLSPSSSSRSGFRITSGGNTIRGMKIVNFPDHGVEICCGARNNLIRGNSISGNGGAGVRVEGSATTRNTITRNAIHNNAGQGIENISGGNEELAPPSLMAAVGNTAAGTAPSGSRVEIFGDDADEGRFFLGSTTADAKGHFEFAGSLRGVNVTATATDGAKNTSEFSSPVVREEAIPNTFETNDDWTLAYPISEGAWVSYISSPTDVDFYKFPVPERGSIVIFTLTDLHEDFDLILYSSTDAPSDTPLADIPLADIPLADIPLADIPLADIPLADIPLADIPLADIPLADIPLADIPLADISFRRGAEDEQVWAVAVYASDFYYVQVLGHNGAYSFRPYTLEAEVLPPPPPLVCSRSLAPGTPGATYQPFSDSDTQTLIITNKQRMEQLYGSAAADDLMSRLRDFADHATVKGMILPVETDPTVAAAYDNWDEKTCNPEAANEVAGAIKELIGAFYDASTFSNLTYLVIAGSDEVLPFRRVLDIVYTSNEYNYRNSAHVQEDSAHFASLNSGYLWTDDFYVDFEPTNYMGRPLYVANYPIGRLVETPDEIIGQLAHYLASGGILTATTSLVAGYDFLTDSSQIISDTFGAQGLANDSLINDGWNAVDLADNFLATRHDLNSINAHFDHWRAVPPDTGAGLFQSDQIDQPDVDLAGAVNFSMGCHAGLSICDLISIGGLSTSLDFAQAFGRKQAIFVGNTGYGYGDTVAPALSEALMSSFAHHLGTEAAVPVGQALVKAKQEYALNNMGFYGPYDEKVLIEATLYGLPMYRVSVPTPGAGEQGSKGAEEQRSWGQFTSAPLHLRTSAQNGLIVRSYTITPTLIAVNTPQGAYYTADACTGPCRSGGVQAVLYRPLQPRVILDVALPDDLGDGAMAHGALFLGGSYRDIPNFDPAITMPVTETTRYEPQWIYTGWRPQGLSRINRFQTPQGLLERLALILGQFRHTDVVENRVMGIERLYDQVIYDVYYSDSDDITPPTIGSVSATQQNNLIIPRTVESVTGLPFDWTQDKPFDQTQDKPFDQAQDKQQTSSARFIVKTSDASGVERVIVVYTNGVGTWESLDLTYDPTADEWIGEATGLTGENIFMAQVVDGAGNVGVSRAKGLYFMTIGIDAGADQTANEGEEITFSGSGPAGITILWDFGDGLYATGAYTPTHWYRDDGLFEARLRVSDEEERIGLGVLFVTINNVPPTVSVDEFTSWPIYPGEIVTFTASFTDPGVLDTHTATIDWGDGTAEAGLVNQRAGGGTASGSHAYADDGAFTVEVCVTDDEGGTGCDTFQVTVQPFPDLFINDYDIWTDPVTIRDGDVAGIGANVHNGDSNTASDIEIRFYDGDPDDGGAIIGAGAYVLPFIPPYGVATKWTGEVWDTSGLGGDHEIYVVIDPDNKIAEGDETNNVASRTITILPPAPDTIPPSGSVSINGGDDITSAPEVVLTLDAQDNPGGTGVHSMYIVEFEFNHVSRQWLPAQESGWMAYTISYPWTLLPGSGVKYIQVWFADGALNISNLPGRAMINYIPGGESIGQGEWRLYRQEIGQGTEVTITLDVVSGDADLHVWNPGSSGDPDYHSINLGTAQDQVVFTAPETEVYQIQVFGFEASVYDLTIETTAGGEFLNISSLNVNTLGEGKTLPDAPLSVVEPPDHIGVPGVQHKLYSPLILKKVTLKPPYEVYLPLILKSISNP